jgi:hypothetical protein
MTETLRATLMAAVEAAKNGQSPAPEVADAIAAGGRDLELDKLGFDSLAWMEFCISIELNSRLELTPEHIAGMTYFFEIEEWLRARL